MSDVDDSPPAKKAKTGALPMCPYGSKCYRKNPLHFKEFAHPSKDDKPSTSAEPSSSASKQIDTSTLPPCPFGAGCYRKNLLHFAQYSHPLIDGGKKSDLPSDSGSDTDVYDSEDDKAASTSKLQKSSSLIKKYSQMNEEERKELIKKAFEMKDQLEKELEETKAEVKEKVKEMKSLQNQMNKGVLLMEGENEVLKGTAIKYFDLYPERSYKEGSAAQLHFRLAESQFYRLLSGPSSTGYQVKKVQYVVNPKLVKQFKKARERLSKTRGEECSYPVLAFHGTQMKNITPICEGGFKVPGDKDFVHRTDTGYYGCGAYFSEFPGMSIGYIQGATKLLLCQILTGKVYQCTKLIQGSPLMDGFDSHRSPSMKELVIFHSDHILPCYIVHYKNSQAEFKYVKPPEQRRQITNKDDMMKLYWKAKKKRKSTLLAGRHVRFVGALCDQHDQLGKLVEKHGGKYVDDEGPPSPTKGRGRGRAQYNAFSAPIAKPGHLGWVYYSAKYIKQFNVLITTSKDLEDNKHEAVQYAKAYATGYSGITMVRQEWLFETLADGEAKDADDYVVEVADN